MEEKNTNNIEEEIDFEKVGKTPIRWFGIIYPYFVGLIMLGGLFYVYNLNSITENKVKPTVQDTTRLKYELPTKAAIMLEGVDIAVISNPTPELITKGKELYSANCSSCHGADGKGDGVAGAGLNPKPRNFTNKDGWTNGMTIADMYKTIQEGISGTGMVAYEYLPVADRFAMIHFIHSLMKDFPKNTPEELAALDQTYSLAAGKIVPNQIPVAKAVKLIKSENEEQSNKAFALAKVIGLDKDILGFKVYDKVVSDRYRAAYFMLKSDKWMGNDMDFRNYISPTISNNGFNPAFLKLNANQISELRAFLIEFYDKKIEAKK